MDTPNWLKYQLESSINYLDSTRNSINYNGMKGENEKETFEMLDSLLRI